ncbi:MAG: 4Fe-4S dicluster domain-containing protein [Clostridia bacterium]|nr:[Fe-Fe] hydrogenase large subunit C-terminal domain-containing protein [Eubacteriales bacterium]NCC48941.1 4Fe-4S dicluster domain-containing protein [Clostridia bacterium]
MTIKRHSVQLNRELCMGCTNCIKRCPTGAIRVRSGKAQIDEDRCLDCGECIRACPHHAKSAIMDTFDSLKRYPMTIALAAPSLYAQFGPPATRPMVLAALANIGFDDVWEVAVGADIFSRAAMPWIEAALAEGKAPLISSACPVVVRLIQMKYPGLIDHLVPYDAPVEIAARLAREEAVRRSGLQAEEIGIFFISPCPAKRSAVNYPIGRSTSQIDGVIAISDAYPMILAGLETMSETAAERFMNRLMADASGIRWGYSGGEALSLETERYLAVDGIHNVMAILEEVENERLKDVDFIEANACLGGCIGGPLTVANRFSAKSRQRAYIEAARELAAHQPEAIFPADTITLSPWDQVLAPNDALRLDADIMAALRKYEQMEKIAADLPGLDCGACGAPDCESLAEDIVRGQASITDCIFKLKERIRDVASRMSDLEEEMNRHLDVDPEAGHGDDA